MSNQPSHRDIKRLVDRLARRIRFQRAVDGFVTGATLTAMAALVSLVLAKTGWIGADAFWLSLGIAAVAPAAFALAGWLRKLDPIALAQRLDRSHSLHDRLSSALAFGEAGPQNEFERAQIEDALRYINNVDLAPAAPFQRPSDFVALAALGLAFAALAVLKPPSHQHPLPVPPPIVHEAILDEATVAMERDRLEKIKDEIAGLQDPEAMKLVEEIDKLLDDVEQRAISEREFLERLEKLEDKYFDTEAEAELERLTEKLKEAAEQLEKENAKDLAQEEEVKELVEALKKEDLTAASKAMEKLAEKLMSKDLSEKQLERIAKLMEKFADKIDPTNPALQKLIEKNKDLIQKLAKKMEGSGLSEDEKQRLKRAQEELEKQLQQQKSDEERDSSRELKRIQRQSREASERATAKAEREDAEKRKNQDKKGEQEKKGQQDQQGNKGEQPDERFENEAGRKAKEASDSMGKKGDEQKRDAAKEMARKQLKDLKESMQRSTRGAAKKGPGEGEQQDQRGEDMKDFLRRAKGMKEADGQKSNEGDGSNKLAGGEGKAESGSKSDGQVEGETNMAGKGEGSRELGEETSLDSRREDVKVQAREGKGPTRSEIIKAASEEGFATTDYKEVYGDYESVVEEVMEKEKIPSGYRFYIKKYFQLIQPQDE